MSAKLDFLVHGLPDVQDLEDEVFEEESGEQPTFDSVPRLPAKSSVLITPKVKPFRNLYSCEEEYWYDEEDNLNERPKPAMKSVVCFPSSSAPNVTKLNGAAPVPKKLRSDKDQHGRSLLKDVPKRHWDPRRKDDQRGHRSSNIKIGSNYRQDQDGRSPIRRSSNKSDRTTSYDRQNWSDCRSNRPERSPMFRSPMFRSTIGRSPMFRYAMFRSPMIRSPMARSPKTYDHFDFRRSHHDQDKLEDGRLYC